MKEITQYLKDVATLECQINTQKRLIIQINQRANSLGRYQVLQKPTLTQEPYNLSSFGAYWLVISILFSFTVWIFIITKLPHGSLRELPTFLALFLIFALLVLIFVIVYLPYRIIDRMMTKRSREKQYRKSLAEYNTRVTQDKQRVNQELVTKQMFYNQVNQIQQEKNRTQSSLNQLYSLNIIHPKYRNLVAISSFYDYFDTGRCTSLTGPGGAYATFEEDLRFRRIESRLDVIISKLDEIIANQQYLGELMQEANSTLYRIEQKNSQIAQSMNRVAENSELTAYNTRCAAQSSSIIEHISVYYALKNF